MGAFPWEAAPRPLRGVPLGPGKEGEVRGHGRALVWPRFRPSECLFKGLILLY